MGPLMGFLSSWRDGWWDEMRRVFIISVDQPSHAFITPLPAALILICFDFSHISLNKKSIKLLDFS